MSRVSDHDESIGDGFTFNFVLFVDFLIGAWSTIALGHLTLSHFAHSLFKLRRCNAVHTIGDFVRNIYQTAQM